MLYSLTLPSVFRRKIPEDREHVSQIFVCLKDFYPTALKGCRGIIFTHGVRIGGRAVGRREIVCLGCISETVRCRKFILGRDIIRGCRCATSWSDLDLTFDLAVVTLTFKILSWLYLRNRKV